MRQRYRRFPRLLVILDGASHTALDNRIRDLAAAAAAGRTLRRGTVIAGAATLTRLREYARSGTSSHRWDPRSALKHSLTPCYHSERGDDPPLS
jgi:hypothetical protein